MSVRKTITRNTLFNASGRMWEALLSLLITPFIVYTIGLADYGVWALLSAFTGYVALLDLGFGSAYVRFIAEYVAKKQHDEVSSVVSTGFFVYILFGTILIAIGWPLIGLGVALAEQRGAMSASQLENVAFLFRAGLVLFAATGCLSPFTSTLAGLQRMDISNMLSIAASIVRVGATVCFLVLGFGVRGLVYATAISLLVLAVGSVWAARSQCPGLRIGLSAVRKDSFRQLFDFGWKTQVSRLSNLIMFETDKIVVGVISGQFGSIALYDLGVSFANKIRQIPLMLLSALTPAAADLDARGRHSDVQELYIRSTKYVAAITIPLLALTAGLAGLIMRVWIGEDTHMSAWVLRIMAVGYVANILPGAGVTLVLGIGRPDIQMKAGLISMTTNIVLTVVLYLTIGFWGIPIATAMSMAISWTWFLYALEPVIAIRPARLLRVSLLWPTIAMLPGFIGCCTTDALLANADTTVVSAAALVIAGSAALISYMLLIRIVPFLDDFDRDFLEKTLLLHRVPLLSWWMRSSRHA